MFGCASHIHNVYNEPEHACDGPLNQFVTPAPCVKYCPFTAGDAVVQSEHAVAADTPPVQAALNPGIVTNGTFNDPVLDKKLEVNAINVVLAQFELREV